MRCGCCMPSERMAGDARAAFRRVRALQCGPCAARRPRGSRQPRLSGARGSRPISCSSCARMPSCERIHGDAVARGHACQRGWHAGYLQLGAAAERRAGAAGAHASCAGCAPPRSRRSCGRHATTLLRADLRFTRAHWREPCYDIWEEERGLHYYTLRVGAAGAARTAPTGSRRAGEAHRGARLPRATRETIRARLDDYWLPERGYYRSRLLDSGEPLGEGARYRGDPRGAAGRR